MRPDELLELYATVVGGAGRSVGSFFSDPESPKNALSGIAATTAENIRDFLSGKRGQELVNRVELPERN